MGQFDNSLGALLIGVFLNTYFYGFVSYQYISYHRKKFNDPRSIHVLVLLLFLLDTFHSISLLYVAWFHAVKNYDNPRALLGIVWPYPATAITTSITAFLVQMFLGYRIFRLTKSKIGYSIIILLSLPSLVIGMTCGVYALQLKSLSDAARLQYISTTWLCLEMGIDSLITGVLICLLLQSRTGFRKSNPIVNQLIRVSIQTGLFTGIFSMVTLILVVKFPTSYLYAITGIPVSSVYTNTLMDTLLVRHALRETVWGGGIDTSDIWQLEDPKPAPRSTDRGVQLHIRTEVYSGSRIDRSHPVPVSPSFDAAKRHLPSISDIDIAEGGLKSKLERPGSPASSV
ncbi:hypothetical protein FPV67DRAFT_759512 [Lyophyllum atratum]|nr:hypothetical protein FPV67DRAFT_759512 [Lyophyllum atratum]